MTCSLSGLPIAGGTAVRCLLLTACLVAFGDAHFMLDGTPSDEACAAADAIVLRAWGARNVTVTRDPDPRPIELALITSKQFLEKEIAEPGNYHRRQIEAALEGVNQALAFTRRRSGAPGE